MSTEKKPSKPRSVQSLLLLAGCMFIMSGLSGMRLGRQVYGMTGASSLDNSGMAIPGSGSTSSYVKENWMYPVGIASLCLGVVTTMAAAIVTIGQRTKQAGDR
jgi:hypothetical protein